MTILIQVVNNLNFNLWLKIQIPLKKKIIRNKKDKKYLNYHNLNWEKMIQ